MAKSSADYWRARMVALEDDKYRKGEAYYKDVQEQFRRASSSIQVDIERWYQRLADNNGVSYAAAKQILDKGELAEFKWSVEEYIKAGEENGLDQRWMRELENASARHHISYLEAMRLQVQQHAELLITRFDGGLTDFLHKSYSDGYYRSAYEIARGTGIGTNLARLDDRRIDAIIRHPWAQDGVNFSGRIWANKDKLVQNLHTELTQSIIRGADTRKAIASLAKTMSVSRTQAGRLVMTESAAISAAAQRDCFVDLGVDKYEVLATLDSHTSETCRELDGKVFDMADYEVGSTAPPYHPWCRSTTIPYFSDDLGGGRAARGEDGSVYYVPADTKYRDWQKQYIRDVPGMGLKSPGDISKITGVTPEIRKEIDDAIAKLSREYDIRLQSISVEPVIGRDIFVSGWYNGGMGLVINGRADFDTIMERIGPRYTSGFFAGKSLEDYIAHEMFHIMAYQDCVTEQQYRAKYMQIEGLFDSLQGISGYADKSGSGNEALAEAFVRVRNGEEVPPIVKVLVESYVGRWRLS